MALAVGGAACRDNADDAEAAARRTRDSAAGEVAQYALMKPPVQWLTDSNLVSLATSVNSAPMALARLQMQAWSNPQVQAFAAEIIRDHAALQRSIDSAAQAHRIPAQAPAVAESMLLPYDSTVASLTGLPATELEPRFLDAMAAMHLRTARDFGALAGNATDPDLRGVLTNKAIQMEQAHGAKAKLIAASLAKADSAKRAAAQATTQGRRGRGQ